MSQWSSAKARRVLAALLRLGWSIKRESSSHKILSRPDWPDVVFAFHDKEEIGPKMLARIAKHTGLKPEDLQLKTLLFICNFNHVRRRAHLRRD
jgi:predicted RNA binding protein YcfA (HicA-like mRNA interferase family)